MVVRSSTLCLAVLALVGLTCSRRRDAPEPLKHRDVTVLHRADVATDAGASFGSQQQSTDRSRAPKMANATPRATRSTSPTGDLTATGGAPSASQDRVPALAGAAPSEPSGSLSPASPGRWAEEALRNRPVPAEVPRLYAKTRHVWIYAEPDATKQWIGYLWSGGSVILRSTRPRYGIGCEFFYAIEPRGYVCTDGGRVTLDPKDPVVVALHAYAPRYESAWPHRYGESRGAPLYFSLPDAVAQRAREPGLLNHLERVEHARRVGRGEGALLDVDLTPAPPGELAFPKLSPSVREAHSELKRRSTVAYSREIRYAERDFYLTADYRFIPKDRVVPYPFSQFHGLRLGTEAKLPLAFIRRNSVMAYRRIDDTHFELTQGTFNRLDHVELSGKSVRLGKTEYLQTLHDEWILREDAVVPTPAEKTPWGALVGQPEASPLRPKGRATWIAISVRGGWLMAYEDTSPVFVTLISPGRGGAAITGRDPLETSATPVGRFSITGKFVTSTMVAPNEFLHSDVPFAQNFTGPYALHAAYWHDNWGNLMSGGCINLSPLDAQFMFHWTEPVAPAGWHGTRWLPYLEPATTLLIHR